MTLKDMLTEEEQDVIARALVSRMIKIDLRIFKMSNQAVREELIKEQEVITYLLEQLK